MRARARSSRVQRTEPPAQVQVKSLSSAPVEPDKVVLVISRLPTDKRTQLSGACLHVAVEHAQAIVLLVDARLVGSALALVRPAVEAWARGCWLAKGATSADLDRAGRDKKRPSFDEMVSDLRDAEPHAATLLETVKTSSLDRLHSFTHTGYQQIGARLTATGLSYGYDDREVVMALSSADMVSLLSALGLTMLAENEQARRAVDDRMLARQPTP